MRRSFDRMNQGATIILFMLAVMSVSVAEPRVAGQNSEKINVYRKYDKKKQETITQTDLMLVYGPDPGPYSLGFGLSVLAAYTFPGQTPSPPDNITLNFMSSENSYVFDSDRGLAIRADDETLNFGKMQYMQIKGTSAVAHEKLWQSIPRDVFARIANSKRVHVKLGQKEFDFTEAHLKNLRALLASVGR